MSQLHKRFSVEQVKMLLESYVHGTIVRAEVEEILQINKTRFFAILTEYCKDPGSFSIAYERKTPAHLPVTQTVIMISSLCKKFLGQDLNLRPLGSRFISSARNFRSS